MGLSFRSVSAPVDESIPPSGVVDLGTFCSSLAEKKIRALQGQKELEGCRWFIAADTLVARGDRIFGKPRDRREAKTMLRELAGGHHRVVTGVAFYDRLTEKTEQEARQAEVLFTPMGEEEISWYLDTDEWQGVAGAYRIQGKGACFIESIQGNYSTIVGLPIPLIYAILRRNDYPFGQSKSSVGLRAEREL